MQEELIEIRKYSNRRLYDTSKSRYVTLADVAQMIRDGKELRVVDAKSNEDLTRAVMLQIICESKAEQEALPVAFLRKVIQAGNKSIRNSIRDYLSYSLNAQKEVLRQVSHLAQAASMANPFLAPFLKDNKNGRTDKAQSKGTDSEDTGAIVHHHSDEERTQPSSHEAQDASAMSKEQERQHAAQAATQAAPSPAKKAPKSDNQAELALLRQQLSLMQQQLDSLSQTQEDEAAE